MFSGYASHNEVSATALKHNKNFERGTKELELIA